MGLSRRIKFKFKFSRKYNTNVYNFFTKKKSTRKVFEQKQALNFLQVEAENLRIKFPILMQNVKLKKYRQQKLITQKKAKLHLLFFSLKQKAKSLNSVLIFMRKKIQKQFQFFFITKTQFFCNKKNDSLFLNFFLNFFLVLFNRARGGNLQQYMALIVVKKKLHVVKRVSNARINLKKYKKFSTSFLKKNKTNTKVFFYNFKIISLFRRLQNLFLFKTRCFNLLAMRNVVSYKKKSLTLVPFKRKSLEFFKLEFLFSLASKFKLLNSFSTKNIKKTFNHELYKREGLELSWFFYDLLCMYYLYEKLQFSIYKNFKLMLLMSFPLFSSKMKTFLGKTFFKTKNFVDFKYNQKAPRVFEFFFTKLQKKYGFKTLDVPFRLDVPLPRYKLKKQTEKLEMYRLLKITRRYYGHLNRKTFWKMRKKAYNKTKGYAFFNQVLLYESRLDVFLIRAQLCNSLQDARNFIYKGWVCVNGKQIYNLNYTVSLMDTVSIFVQKMLKFKHFFLNKSLQLLNEYSTTIGKIFPKYLESNFLNMAFCYVPKIFSIEKIPGQFELNKLIVLNWGKFAY